jgi:valyl-tRNA synthetase
MEISSKYNPQEVEEKWYKFWNDKQYFRADIDKEKQPFTIVIPPPNITGSLHMGHALNNILQDILIRWKRMSGYSALWLPGTDHGGIATQNVVEKKLLKEGTSRQKLGRDKFRQIMEQWSQDTRYAILTQLEKLGCSCDWSRKRFTLDEQCSRAVMEAFVTLYNQGLIYRGEHIVDWCPRCGTALNESEVEHENEKSKLWYIRYLLEKPTPEQKYIVVATTRPETMLGDTAVAVNPQDKRYKKLIGQKVILPLINRHIPIIGDEAVLSEFGTGAVKVTPAHDPNDWEIAKRHKLVSIQVIDKEAKITNQVTLDLDGQNIISAEKVVAGYVGLDRYKVREKLIEDLRKDEFLEKEEDYTIPITRCYRCNSATEPLVSEQWYLKTKEMAKRAIKVAEEGKTKFIPDNWMKPYLLWLENLHDWCISRQIWWGHQIPAWYCKGCGEDKITFLSKTEYYLKPGSKPDYVGAIPPKKCPHCGKEELFRDPDVLDTWFSSALWPFSTLGWPQETDDLAYFYPTSVLVTGHEIIYLWVARMIMMGLTLNGDIPFPDIYIHGIVRDEKGKKMSKSLGNVIDPLEITAKCGTDALRFTLAANGIMGRDLQLAEGSFDAYRNFCNKIWNASRFVMMNLEGFAYEGLEKIPAEELTIADRWILSEYNQLVGDMQACLNNYNLSEAARLLYEFIWSKFCDWYVELIKPRLYAETGQPTSEGQKTSKKTAQTVSVYVLEGTLRLLHPFMPFITEEIWQNLKQFRVQGSEFRGKTPEIPESIMISSWPQFQKDKIDAEAAGAMSLIIGVITAIRNIRGEMRINSKDMLDVIIKLGDAKKQEILKENQEYICRLARIKELKMGKGLTKPPSSATQVVDELEIYIPLAGVIDLDLEKERLEKEIAKINIEIEKIDKKLGNKNFVEKAPAAEVERVKNNLALFEDKKRKLENNLAMLK